MNILRLMATAAILSHVMITPATATQTPAASNPAAPTLTNDYVMLKVNGEEIKRSAVDAIWSAIFPAGSAPSLDTAEEKVKQNVLRGVVGEYLLAKKAVESNIEQKPEVQNRLAMMKKKIIVESFLKEKAASQVTPAALKAEYDRQADAMKNEVEVRASHILVKDKETADKLLKQISGGTAFEEVAKANSSDKASAVAGGDLGYFTKDKMVKAFADAAFAMEVGKVSEPVKSDFGWHIIKVTDSRKVAMKPFIEERPVIEQKLRAVALSKYIDDLVNSSNVEYLDKDGKKLEFIKVPAPTPVN
jgi:peptidyl-prolyl cis-trans isomerase C